MIGQKYNEVFEFIKSSLVPKCQLDESKNEIMALKTALENATNDLRKTKSEFEEQKLAIDIIQAEKESLEAEKKTIQIQFNEISLKLKQKTQQYDSLLKSPKTDTESPVVGKSSTQIIKEEPKEIKIVNFPSSLKQSATETKRTHSSNDEAQRKIAKRLKTTRSSTKNFSCDTCLDVWGTQIQNKHFGNPEDIGAPDPKLNIPTFSTFRHFKNHQVSTHCLKPDCHEEIRCLLYSGHHRRGVWPHGDIKCKICCLSFKFQNDHDDHMQLQHADLKIMDNEEIYDLFFENQWSIKLNLCSPEVALALPINMHSQQTFFQFIF